MVHLNLGAGEAVSGEKWKDIPSTAQTLRTNNDWDLSMEDTQHMLRQQLLSDIAGGIPEKFPLPNLRDLHWSGSIMEVRGLLREAPNLMIMKGSVNTTCDPNMLSAWIEISSKMNDGLRGTNICLYIENNHGPT